MSDKNPPLSATNTTDGASESSHASHENQFIESGRTEYSNVLHLNEVINKARKVAEQVAIEAGKLLTEKYFQRVDFEFKADKSHVTEADKEVEHFIHDALKKSFPDIGFYGEESGQETMQSDLEWVVDPLDGTINFGNGIDIYGISIGLRHKGIPIAGVIHIPAQNDLFSGDVINGSTLNDKPIHVYNGPLDKKKPYADTPWAAEKIIVSENFEGTKGKPRVIGSAVHKFANVANGGYGFSIGSNCYIWDICAALAIIRGAGGDMLIWDDNQWKHFEDIESSRFNQSFSFPSLAASKDNLPKVGSAISLDMSRSNQFIQEKSKLGIVFDTSEMPAFDKTVLEKFSSLIPTIAEITRSQCLNQGADDVRYKEDDSEQTPTDVNIEKQLKELLLEQFPGFNFIGEETEKVLTDSDYSIVVDPIDGTANYANGLPIYSTTIAINYRGKPISGLIYFPTLDMAVFNDHEHTYSNHFNRKNEWVPRPVCIRDDIFESEDQNIPFGFDSYARRKAGYGQDVSKILKQPRTFGGATSIVAYTATGSLGGFILSSAKLHDYAGGVSLIEKSGGKVFVLDDENGQWKEFSLMFDRLKNEPDKKRFVVGGGPKTVERILRNIHPKIK